MNKRLLVLSVNILAVSGLILLYGLVVGEASLVGVSLSSFLVGLVLLAFSFTVTETLVNSLIEYSRLASNALTSIAENLDLLESKTYITHNGEELNLVVVKVSEPKKEVNPGFGVVLGEPYLSIPVSEVLKDVPRVDEISEETLKSSLNSVLVESLGLCSKVSVSQRGNYVRVELISLNKALEDLAGMPLNPFVTLVSVALARTTDKDLKLIEKGRVVDGVYYTYEMRD